MTAFDTDVLTDLLGGRVDYLARRDATPEADRFVPVVAVGEILRGLLSGVRRAEAGQGRVTLEFAYLRFETRLRQLRPYHVLGYTVDAHARYESFRTTKLRVGTNDLRIAAICLAHDAKLVTRNARDYTQVPGLTLEVWP